ncbi:MAG: hypothetical protein U0441_11345 [Polyangiaceae bacterium]
MTREETILALTEGKDEDAVLAALDRQNPEHRSTVISAIEILVVDRVLAALDCPPSKNRFDVFDLDAIAGVEVAGLVLGLFARRLDGLRRPDGERLRKAIEYIGIKIRDDAGRDKFYRAWAANEAACRVDSMLDFLTFGIAPMNEDVRRAVPEERARLAALREKGLPEDVAVALELTDEKYRRIVG